MNAKQDNVVDADASGAKTSTKHLELRSEVIQGQVRHFGIAEKRTRDCVLLNNNVSLRVGTFYEKV